MQLKFGPDVNTWFCGRNGTFQCAGVELSSWPEVSRVRLTPITQRNREARGYVEIPHQAIPQLLDMLQLAYAEWQSAPVPANETPSEETSG